MERPLPIFLCFELLHLNSIVSAQNFELIGKNKALTSSDGVSLNQMFYFGLGMQSRRDPYPYYFSGNVSFSWCGLNIPRSFTVSNQNTTFLTNHNSSYKTSNLRSGFIYKTAQINPSKVLQLTCTGVFRSKMADFSVAFDRIFSTVFCYARFLVNSPRSFRKLFLNIIMELRSTCISS
jgi:hypothetical protein